jgi:triacylglycerol lipase
MLKPPPDYEGRLVLRPEQDRDYLHFENAGEHPFQANPRGFPRVNVWWLAEAALLSYWDPTEAKALFSAAGLDSQLIKSHGTECYLAWQDAWVLVAFRGTEGDQWDDVLTDARLAQTTWLTGHVHSGFASAVHDIWPALTGELRELSPSRTVWFTGHSLGAGLATLAADLFADTRGVCTFGSPRVGNPSFSSAFTSKFAGRHLRYVNAHDVVTHAPPPLLPPWRYRHVDPRQFIAPDGEVSYGSPAIPHFFSDLIGPPQALLEQLNGLQRGSLVATPRSFLDHMPKAYAIWAWNDYQVHG